MVLQKGLDEGGGQLHQVGGESIVHTVTVCKVLRAGLGEREGWREGRREGEWERGREGWREGGRERGRERGRKGRREGERERRREGEREGGRGEGRNTLYLIIHYKLHVFYGIHKSKHGKKVL